MNPNYDSHILRWKNVNWPSDEPKLLASIRSCKGREVLARVRQGEKLVEVASPNGDFTKRLKQGNINLHSQFELEVITRGPALGKSEPVEQKKAEDFTDRNDFNTLQWNGERGTGTPVFSRVRNTPMFFRNNGMNADLVDLYAGQTLFLVLNGGSLAGFDWSRLKQPGICTLGVNNGAHLLRPTFWTSVDDPTRFMRSIWADPTITKFIPMSHFHKPIWEPAKNTFSDSKVKDFPNVYGYRRNEAFQASQWLFEDTINWGNHGHRGGGRSVMLAALRIAFLLGFRRVCLVGCDFYMDDNNRYFFAEERSKQAISNNQNSYRIMMGFFEELQPHFLDAGFHVVNCNPKSQLKVFPFADLEEELNSARTDTTATTMGMYVDRYKEQKQEQKQKQAQQEKQDRHKRPAQKAPAPVVAKQKGLVKPSVPAAPQAVQRTRRIESIVLDHLIKVLRAAPVLKNPFDHLELNAAFPEDVYREMLSSLPEDRYYHELKHADAMQPDGHSARLRFGFSAEEIGRLPAHQQRIWSQLRTVMHDPRLEATFRTVFNDSLRQRFGKGFERLKLKPQPELIRDLMGYRIGVHPDIPNKVITIQFYLPADKSMSAWGTTYYRRESRKYEAVKRLEFAPRSGHAFVVNDHSFHGVDVKIADGQQRNSLMLTYYQRER